MKNKLNIILVLLGISIMNTAMADNTTYIPVFWDKNTPTPNMLNVQFKTKKDCEILSQKFVKPGEKDSSIYLYDCTQVFTKNQERSYWFMTMWNEKENKPIVLPLALEDKKSCDNISVDMNNITKSTIKVERDYFCKSVSNVYNIR